MLFLLRYLLSFIQSESWCAYRFQDVCKACLVVEMHRKEGNSYGSTFVQAKDGLRFVKVIYETAQTLLRKDADWGQCGTCPGAACDQCRLCFTSIDCLTCRIVLKEQSP